MGLLDGKVVLITGAGNGIGRAHALACAREGARIVVNDLGGSRDGTGASAGAAQVVVDEIKAMGGDAVANTDSVTDKEGCERMVKAALDKWGRLDAVVNNAGILRDKTFAKLSDEEWDLVVSVHLTGTRNVTRAALEALQKQGGAIINTTSYSGMIGNFGQSNYAAAKAGIYGFTRVLSMELRKFGITANCIAPVAKTRMTEDIQMVEADWVPEQISPMVVFLASDLAKSVTGQVFGVQGQRIHLYEVKTNDGVEKPGKEHWTAQEISEKLRDIMRWEAPAPAAAAGGGEDIVTQVFKHFPAGFKAGAVPGWKTTMHWVVKGGADQTVVVDGDKCTVATGLQGSPTCTVKTDKDTLVAMFKGEIEPPKAFMSGKASADNMGDLMKMGMAFDFKKVAAAFMAAGGGAAAAAPAAAAPAEDIVGKVFGFFPQGFKTGAVPGWKTTMHWVVKGGTDQTVVVDGDKCTVAAGLQGTPTCTVKVDKDTLLAMFSGQLEPAKAFMSGKASADNMGDLMKMGMAFDFKKVAAAFEASGGAKPAAAAPAAAPAAPAGEKKLPIGKRYEGGFWFVDKAEFQAYAKATDDENPAYFSADPIAPPMYHVKPFIKLMFKLATDPELELDLLRLVHGEHAVTFHKPLKHGDLLELRGDLKSVEEKSSGRVVNFGLYGFVAGELAVEGTTTYFIRGKKKPEEGGEKKPAAAPEPLPTPDFTIPEVVTADQASRYAVASGDDNPIHVDPATAKAAGLPGVILHGMCTMAFAQRDIVNTMAGGDPRKLKHLGVRLAKPVLPGQTLTLKAWKKGDRVDFITENAEGVAVITGGKAVIG
jgi:NAD(P)-dependent dehydrogenase (short-subunit alcohol dehydrogenase family)/acyl dehydratase/putative sterol carrier protein